VRGSGRVFPETWNRCDAPRSVATVGLGSNLGDRQAAISGAIQWIAERPGSRLLSVSSLYETEPFGRSDQGWFLNCVAQVETFSNLKVFFRSLQEAETLWARERDEHWGPRTLDLDLLFFGDTVFSDEELTVPHPGVAQRRFVLAPLFEVAPDLIHPTLHMSVRELLKALEDPCRVVRLGRLDFGGKTGNSSE
jgi:2-amino-4-hydroxy-6-hydroxymethyldihydropteridine diphosphokinase